jgi:hypothetical protein
MKLMLPILHSAATVLYSAASGAGAQGFHVTWVPALKIVR